MEILIRFPARDRLQDGLKVTFFLVEIRRSVLVTPDQKFL